MPSVLYIVLDDVGYSAMAPFRGLIDTAAPTAPGRTWCCSSHQLIGDGISALAG
jgi:arylsulfatase A-like enzyme